MHKACNKTCNKKFAGGHLKSFDFFFKIRPVCLLYTHANRNFNNSILNCAPAPTQTLCTSPNPDPRKDKIILHQIQHNSTQSNPKSSTQLNPTKTEISLIQSTKLNSFQPIQPNSTHPNPNKTQPNPKPK